jgi:hypothetical protein
VREPHRRRSARLLALGGAGAWAGCRASLAPLDEQGLVACRPGDRLVVAAGRALGRRPRWSSLTGHRPAMRSRAVSSCYLCGAPGAPLYHELNPTRALAALFRAFEVLANRLSGRLGEECVLRARK